MWPGVSERFYSHMMETMRKLSAYLIQKDVEFMPMLAPSEVASYLILEKIRETTKTWSKDVKSVNNN
jgi:hypothetical protein